MSATLTPEKAALQTRQLRELGYGEAQVTEDGRIEGVDDAAAARRTLEELEADTFIPPILPGTQQTLDLKVGGRKQPTGAVLKLKGGEYPVQGQYAMGDKVLLLIEAEVEEIRFKRVRDRQSGAPIGINRVHHATISDVQGADDQPDPQPDPQPE